MKRNVIHKFSIRLFVFSLLAMVSSIAYAYDFEVDGLCYNIIADDQVEITYKDPFVGSYSGTLQIPKKVKYNKVEYKVTSIGNSAFHNCSGLSGSLTIPNSVTSIGDLAFGDCSGLTGPLTLPNSVVSIGEHAFSRCSGFTGSLTIPNSVTSIGGYAFSSCSGLTGQLTLSNSLTYLGEMAFAMCGFTGELTIPGSLSTIEQYTFASCNSISSVNISEGVRNIGDSAFENCGKISSFILPESLTSIGKYSFNQCFSLSTITIPKNVSSIGDFAFRFCNKLESVISEIEEPFAISENVFPSPTSLNNIILYIPKGTKSAYNQYAGWTRNFSKILEEGEEDLATYSLSITSLGNGSASYDGNTIKSKTSSFTVNEGTKATISFTPDNGYRIKSVNVDSKDVTSKVSNNQYTVTVNSNTTVEVEFEAIPVTTYTLSIKATGNGSASYDGNTIKSKTSTFTVNEGTKATISFTADNGYRIKSVKVDSKDVTSKVSNNQYTVTVNSNTTVEVEFEAIPVTTYTLSIKASGNGSASYDGNTIKSKTSSFTVNEGTKATISFTPDNGYRIKSLKANNKDVTSSVSNNKYTVTVNSDTSVEVEFEAIPVTTYTLSIKATGNGSASYDGNTIKSKTSSFTVNEGTKATISFTPDNGYRIKSVKANNKDMTSSVSNNQYTVTVNSDTTVEVEFEAIPVTTYTLSIKTTGNGSASYGGESIRNNTKSYTLNSGTSVSVTFTPDNGYRIKDVEVNGGSVILGSNNSYTMTINSNTTIEVVFEKIPETPTTYKLTISSSGNGVAIYNGENIRQTSKNYTLDEDTYVTITFTPDEGYQIENVKVNGSNIGTESSYSTKINANTTVEVVFEAIPVTTYTLTVTASGNGIATFNGTEVRDGSQSFTVNEGSDAIISFIPDTGFMVEEVKVDGNEVEFSESYTISDITSDKTIEVVFVELDRNFNINGASYHIESFDDYTVTLTEVQEAIVVEVADKIDFGAQEWNIIGISENALDNCDDIAAIVWNLDIPFTAKVTNPNLLLYVKDETYAPASIRNVVVNGFAKTITLTDAQSGNNFYCPSKFTTQSIIYTHNYSMKTGLNESKGWETIALPFDVQQISHSGKGEIIPFAKWNADDDAKPFWLYELTGNGFVEAEELKANTPYIISMPNNDLYPNDYQLSGRVTFSALNAEVKKSDDIQTATFGNNTFVPAFTNYNAESGYYVLNVNNDFETYQGSANVGSKFILNLRRIHPFEAYMTSTSSTRSIEIFDGMTTSIRDVLDITDSQKTQKVYDLSGRLIVTGTSLESIRQELPAGVYIINNKKMIIK